jgi:hypothetical protein
MMGTKPVFVKTLLCHERNASVSLAAWFFACAYVAVALWQPSRLVADEPRPVVQAADVPWAGRGQYRILVTVAPRKLDSRNRDEMPARLKVDLAHVLRQLGVEGKPDLGRIQVIRHDAKTKKPIACASFRGQGPYDVPYRFDDFDRRELCFWYDVEGNGHSGQLVWTHTQEANSPACYAIYFDVVKPGQQSGESPIPLLGDGDALWTDHSDGFLITALHCKPTMCDWNGDGLLDLLVGEIQGHIFYFENIGTKHEPKFARGRFLMLDDKPLRFEHYTTPCAVDWNDDGKLDLLVGRSMGGQILFLENVGTRTEPKLALRGNVEADGKPITLPTQLNPGETFFTQDYMAKPEVVDWNGDGYKDLLAGGYVSGAIFYYENVRKEKGIPKLVARGPISADGKTLRVGSAASPCAADFSGNGLLDMITARGNIVMGQRDPTGITYFKNVGTRTSPDLKERPFPFTQPCHAGVVAVPCAADWNGDGLLDLVIGDDAHVRLYRNVGSRTEPRFELAQTLKNQWGPVRTGGFSTSPADWNGDGNLDLVYAWNGHIELKLNVDPRNPPRWKDAGGLHAGGKPVSYVFPIGDAEMFPLAVDFNRDGLPDLVLGLADGHVWYYKNIGTRTEPKLAEGARFRLNNGGFVKVGRYKEGDKATDFATHSGDRSCPKVADFSGDGVMDLMVSDAYGDVTYFENVGSNEKPVFAPGVKVLHESDQRAMIAVTDWDHDGRVDIILPLQDSIYLCRNVGKGREQRFQRDRELIHQYMPFPNPYIIDWNRDGDEDLLVSSSYGVCYLFERSYIQGGYAEATVVGIQRKP